MLGKWESVVSLIDEEALLIDEGIQYGGTITTTESQLWLLG